jgi:hypothetical protein
MRASHYLVFATLVLSPLAQAVTYDAASDWSDSTNPNGPWAYGTLSAGSFHAFAVHVSTYINVGPPAFSSPQPAWTDCANTGNNGCPEGFARSIGVALTDFPAGRIGGHTPVGGTLALQWTAPASGTIDVVGGTWMWADFGRTLMMTVLFNGVPLFAPAVIPTQAAGTNSNATFSFAQAAATNANALLGLAVHAGDTVTWAVTQVPGSVEWVAGVDMTVSFAPVPEIPSPWLVLCGLPLVMAAANRRLR